MIGIPRPQKKDRPNEIRKREIRRKDKELQLSIGKGICERCGMLAERVGHHVVRRRNMDLRYDMSNIQKICYPCHDLIHRGL